MMHRALYAAVGGLLLAGCGRDTGARAGATAAGGAHRDAVVVASVGEPGSLMPPLVVEAVGRDISDLVFERLADLDIGKSPADTSAYRPRLAASWQRVDSLTWRFRLRPSARWQDGRPVTAEDVRFSFEVFTDSVIDSPARSNLAGLTASVVDSGTVDIRFPRSYPEQLYDATYHVRILPKHVWASVPREGWVADTSLARLVGSGPYRLKEWKRGQHAVLEADSAAAQRVGIRRVVWRFTGDPDAALNLVLSGAADAIETVGGAAQVARVRGDSTLVLRSYPSAAYGFLAFRVADKQGRPHPLLGDRAVRRALASAIDRAAVARALLGPETPAPPGPMSRLLWVGTDSIAVLPVDTAAAARELAAAKLRLGRPIRFDILVPTSSVTRREAAVLLQEAWRRAGAQVTVTAVDFPVFEERLRHGKFDTYIGAYLDEPSARGIADQWSRAGWESINYGHYANAAFDALLARAAATPDVGRARRLYREALDTLNADAPAIFLYNLVNTAAFRRTLGGIEIDPYAWSRTLPQWRLAEGGS
jgi:peptide/nickel transport system substrate-binding protein